MHLNYGKMHFWGVWGRCKLYQNGFLRSLKLLILPFDFRRKDFQETGWFIHCWKRFPAAGCMARTLEIGTYIASLFHPGDGSCNNQS